MGKKQRPEAIVSKIMSQYGMLGILLLLCAYYSIATITEQHPAGEDAAFDIVKSLPADIKSSSTILIIAKDNEEDRLFAERLDSLIKENRPASVETIIGEPVEIRKRLEAISMEGGRLNLIAASQSYRIIITNIKNSYDNLKDVEILTPSSYKWPTFLLKSNLLNVMNQITVIAIIAVGMTMVIITGGIDLSVGSLLAFSSVVAAWLIQRLGGTDATILSMFLASIAAMALCGGIGAFSGFMITRFKIPPFIATLAIMQVASGLAYIISQGKPIYKIPNSFTLLGRGSDPVLSIPYAVLLMAAIYIIAHILMTRTVPGRYIYAVGGNAEAARLSGIKINAVIIFVYTTCAVTAGLGGIIMASQLKSGAPTYGLMYELYVIAAVVVGGTSLSGGEGKITGTLIGAFIIAVIQNGMNLTNVESYTQKVVLGLVILGAVLLDMRRKAILKGRS